MDARCYREGCPRQEAQEPHAHVQVHYQRPLIQPGHATVDVPTYSIGALVHDPAGQVVLVVVRTYRLNDPLGAGVYGPSDLPADAVIAGDRSDYAELSQLPGWGSLVVR